MNESTHGYEAEVDLVINGRSERFVLGYDILDQGRSICETGDEYMEPAEVQFPPILDLVSIVHVSQDPEDRPNIVHYINADIYNVARKALDIWVASNIEPDDRTHYILIDKQSGNELV